MSQDIDTEGGQAGEEGWAEGQPQSEHDTWSLGGLE